MGDKSSGGSGFSAKPKLQFAPKVPSGKSKKPVAAEMKPPDDEDKYITTAMLKKLKPHEGSGKKLAKMPSKSIQDVTFGHVDAPPYARSFGNPRTSTEQSEHDVEPVSAEPEDGSRSTPDRTPGIAEGDFDGDNNRGETFAAEGGDVLPPKSKNLYYSAFDEGSFYPTILPLRNPDSGRQEDNRKDEFVEASASSTQEEFNIKTAEVLGLKEKSQEARMLFVQLPTVLPLEKQLSSAEKKAAERQCASENSLPRGFMGKMLVYKSGAIKMKLGDVLFDVSAGFKHYSRQDVVVINTQEKHFCHLGSIHERAAVVTPDMDALLGAKPDSN